jgi:hypothetical protein
VGRGATGRLFSLTAAGREFEFEFGTPVRFTLPGRVVFTLPVPVLALARFAFSGLFALLLAFAFSFAFLLRGGRFGLLSLLFAAEFVLRFSAGSSGVTLSGDSPSFTRRLMSIATV